MVAIPPGQAWSFMSDFSIAHKYVPGIVKTEVLEGPITGVDAHRLVFDNQEKQLMKPSFIGLKILVLIFDCTKEINHLHLSSMHNLITICRK